MLNTSENSETKYYFLSYKAEGKQAKFDFSKIEINGKNICRYTPQIFLKGQANLFNPAVSFRIMLQFILLDKKGKIKFLNADEFLQAIILLDGIDYNVNTYGAYYHLSINNIKRHD